MLIQLLIKTVFIKSFYLYESLGIVIEILKICVKIRCIVVIQYLIKVTKFEI